METESLIPTDEFCAFHNIEYSFISSLQDVGLIKIITLKETRYISESQVKKLEKILRLHDELEINIEGIDTISHLLQRMRRMQIEIHALKNKLRLYEDI